MTRWNITGYGRRSHFLLLCVSLVVVVVVVDTHDTVRVFVFVVMCVGADRGLCALALLFMVIFLL